MELTTEQTDAVGKGEVVTFEINGQPVVLLRKDIYEKTRLVVDYSELNLDEALANIDEVWGEDPALDLYQKYKK
ncbi:MAG: hypothetical protein JWM11_3447 [Planctomycetaceae bacterium]|nr:hypothetical protein [Planctomycetaceae bacterium]